MGDAQEDRDQEGADVGVDTNGGRALPMLELCNDRGIDLLCAYDRGIDLLCAYDFMYDRRFQPKRHVPIVDC